MVAPSKTVVPMHMMKKLKVLIFLTFDYPVMTGTTLWTKHFLERMAEARDIELIVVFSGPIGNQAFVQTVLGSDYLFVPFRQFQRPDGNGIVARTASVARKVWKMVLEKYYFWNERLWLEQRHVDAELGRIVRERRPDLVVLGGISAAFCAPSVFSSNAPCCLVSLNNEIAIYREVKAEGGRTGMGPVELWIFRRFNWLSNMRVVRHVNDVYRKCAGVVTLTQSDQPPGLPARTVRSVIPPVLRRKDQQWVYQRTRRVLFVGNMFIGTMMHYPNRLSIEWICSRLAPELLKIDDKVTINIIGATADQVSGNWRWPNIHFLGRADQRELVRQMTTADLFIAPIANNYGAKLKLAECVAYGMPFVATEGAMSGLPFLDFMPRIDLNRPQAAASLVMRYMNGPEELVQLSRAILACSQRALAEEGRAWEAFLRRSAGDRTGEAGQCR